mgnify:CR=1 FL=1
MIYKTIAILIGIIPALWAIPYVIVGELKWQKQ